VIDKDDRVAIADERLARLEPGFEALKASVSAQLHEALGAEVRERLDHLRDEVLRGHSEWLAAMHATLSQQMDDALNEGRRVEVGPMSRRGGGPVTNRPRTGEAVMSRHLCVIHEMTGGCVEEVAHQHQSRTFPSSARYCWRIRPSRRKPWMTLRKVSYPAQTPAYRPPSRIRQQYPAIFGKVPGVIPCETLDSTSSADRSRAPFSGKFPDGGS
jgi:hypothetical protein